MAKTLFQMANEWLNVPFRFHGRDKNGCDCVGFVIGVLYENGLMSKQTFTALNKIKYGTNLSKITNSMLFEKLLPYFTPTNIMAKTDLIVIKTRNSPIHFAIYNHKTDEIIHTTNEFGKVVKTTFDKNLSITAKFTLKKYENYTSNKKNII